MVVGIILSGILCAALCSVAPRVADRLMRGRREAHKAWFECGANGYAISPEAEREWAATLPRLIEDRAISREDAEHAAALGVAGLPDTSALPDAVEIDARFTVPHQTRMRLVALFALAGFSLGATFSILGLDATQIALLSMIASACATVALVDQRCRIITDSAVMLLCLLGTCLRIACNQQAEIVWLCVAAGALCAFMHAADAIYARLHAGRAIGNGDKKVMAAVVICSGASGIAAATVVLIVLLAATLLICKDRAAKRAFGPYAAAAILVGAIASV